MSTNDDNQDTNLRRTVRDRFSAILGDGTPDSQTLDDTRDNYGFFAATAGGDFDRREPRDDDLQRYWRQYETTPIVRESINKYSDDVVEPGYRVVSENDELQDRLESWLKESAIINGESNHDFNELLEAAIVQREVRGTALVELVPQAENPSEFWGFKLVNVATVQALTYDNQNILIRPDDTGVSGVPTTSSGEAAAYIQFHDMALAGPFRDADEVPLSQNDLIKWTLDGDADDLFGTSRIEAVSDKIDGLHQILADNEEAIAAKGHPYWIFKLGEPQGDVDNPRAGIWPDEKVKALRDEHKRDNFSAGQKDFLPGDVDVDVISGETADIEDVVDFYIEYIMSALPTPKYMVGFADSVNRDITTEQEAMYKNRISKTRRDIEAVFEPAIQRKAEEWGYDADVELRIEPEAKESPLKNDDFGADEFQMFAQGIKSLSPGGSAEMVMTPREVRTKVLGLPPEPEGSTEASDGLPEIDDEDIVEAYQALYSDDAQPDNQFAESDD